MSKFLKKREDVVFPISDEELCNRYEKVTTPMVNDVLREMQYLYQTLPVNILPLKDNMKVAGIKKKSLLVPEEIYLLICQTMRLLLLWQ